jgi:S1-C subfamily serine protease
VPGLTRRLLLAVLLATLVPAVAASPAGAAGHSTHATPTAGPNAGIVDIYTTLGYEDGAAAAGTGMLISRTGTVLTNNHVIKGATKFKVVEVTTHRSYNATVTGYSVSHDIAVLQLANASHMRSIKLGGHLRVQVGQQVVARGNAQGLGGAKAAHGRVIALHRTITAQDETGQTETLTNIIATNAPVEPGDSGGPLMDARNRVLGMVTAGSSKGAVRGFAIPIRHALAYARLIKKGKSSATIHIGPTAFLGVQLKDVSGGTLIQQVLPNLAAEAAGLVAGDVITSLNGTAISTSMDIRKTLLSLVPGTAVAIEWTDANGVARAGTITPTSGPPQ